MMGPSWQNLKKKLFEPSVKCGELHKYDWYEPNYIYRIGMQKSVANLK
jgi:hypothetical protein